MAQPAIQSARKSLGAPITSTASFDSFLRTHRAAVVFFTDAMCAPCRAIEPVVERIAHEKEERNDGQGVAFAKVEVDNAIAVQHEITATPAFLFFWKGEVVCILVCFSDFTVDAITG